MTTEPASCAWCGRPIPPDMRADAICCSKQCRQARHRFTRDVGSAPAVAAGHPRRLAYADPPYPGRARKYYGQHQDYAGEVDHAALVASLSADYDAWALSTSADALQAVLAICPPGVRVAAWHRGERPHKDATGPLNAWEPVIYGGQFRVARPLNPTRRSEQLRRVVEDLHDVSRPPGGDVEHDASQGSARRVDSLVFRPGVRSTEPGRVTGAKPATFWRWVFELLGATPVDSFDDIFPASGAGSRAWTSYVDVSRRTTVERGT